MILLCPQVNQPFFSLRSLTAEADSYLVLVERVIPGTDEEGVVPSMLITHINDWRHADEEPGRDL